MVKNKWNILASIVACALCFVSFTACRNKSEQQENTTISTVTSTEHTNAEKGFSTSAVPELSSSYEGSEESPANEETAAKAVQGNVNSKAEIVRVYAEAYNKTKAARSLAGTDSISILPGTLTLNGSASSTVEKLINSNVNRIFSRGAEMELPPGGESYQTCILREEDVKAASMKDDGTTITLKIVPRDSEIPIRGKGGSGNFTEVVSVDMIKELADGQGVSFSDGQSFDDCVTLEFLGTESTIEIDKVSGMITKAQYKSLIYAKAEHVNVAWFQNQSASATICYTMDYPAAK